MADTLGADAHDLRNILESAHDEGEAPAVVRERKRKKVQYREFKNHSKQVMYDTIWIYKNLGRAEGDWVWGRPTLTAIEIWRQLNKDPEAKMKFIEGTMKPIVLTQAKMKAKRIELAKRLTDDGRETIEYLTKYRDDMIKQGFKG